MLQGDAQGDNLPGSQAMCTGLRHEALPSFLLPENPQLAGGRRWGQRLFGIAASPPGGAAPAAQPAGGSARPGLQVLCLCWQVPKEVQGG